MMTKSYSYRGRSSRARARGVAARIQPLPANIVPTEFFLAQMRRRLLELQPAAGARRAA